MKAFNKVKINGFTLNKEYEFSVLDNKLFYEVVNDFGEKIIFSKIRMLNYFKSDLD